jgi:hypothetical protein
VELDHQARAGVAITEIEVGDEGAGDALELAASPAAVAVGALEIGDEVHGAAVGALGVEAGGDVGEQMLAA